jgi:hypothetical protein
MAAPSIIRAETLAVKKIKGPAERFAEIDDVLSIPPDASPPPW